MALVIPLEHSNHRCPSWEAQLWKKKENYCLSWLNYFKATQEKKEKQKLFLCQYTFVRAKILGKLSLAERLWNTQGAKNQTSYVLFLLDGRTKGISEHEVTKLRVCFKKCNIIPSPRSQLVKTVFTSLWLHQLLKSVLNFSKTSQSCSEHTPEVGFPRAHCRIPPNSNRSRHTSQPQGALLSLWVENKHWSMVFLFYKSLHHFCPSWEDTIVPKNLLLKQPR